MFKRLIQSVAVMTMLATVTFTSINQQQPETKEEIVTVKTQEYISEQPANHIELKTMTKSISIGVSEEDIDLIALVTMAEAEGESELGKRLVISTILNRVDSEHFPDTIEGVIYQPNQFSAMWNDRIDRCYVREDIRQLVEEELISRTNDEVIFFCAGDYSIYGSHMFPEGNHYFSSYN